MSESIAETVAARHGAPVSRGTVASLFAGIGILAGATYYIEESCMRPRSMFVWYETFVCYQMIVLCGGIFAIAVFKAVTGDWYEPSGLWQVEAAAAAARKQKNK